MKFLDQFHFTDDLNVEQVELKGFSRSVVELEWLILILVILYSTVPGSAVDDKWLIIKSSLFFAGFVLAFRYLNFYKKETRWKLAIEVWVMIGFITFVLWHTGRIESPLLNLYLLVIITSGLTLGKLTTVLILVLITCVYLYMGQPVYAGTAFSLQNFSQLMAIFSPYLLIAYLTTMLSADLQYARKMFKHLSEVDEMTGLFNIRSFNNTLTAEIMKSARYKRIFSLLMIDADNLKEVNDRYGHEAGNRLIKALSDTIKSCLRESDILARYGGDEFIALLPETDSENAVEVGDRIRKAVENTAFDMEGNQIKTTVSIGIANFPKHAENTDSLLHKVDRAMYQSKNSGRNRVTLYSESESRLH
ncbi:MAG: GGDEF domain-containing protein [Gammaproteobacteria bacterium]|nr:GGDEF domain-containing protein [Gammaproteobacteria bacterium]